MIKCSHVPPGKPRDRVGEWEENSTRIRVPKSVLKYFHFRKTLVLRLNCNVKVPYIRKNIYLDFSSKAVFCRILQDFLTYPLKYAYYINYVRIKFLQPQKYFIFLNHVRGLHICKNLQSITTING